MTETGINRRKFLGSISLGTAGLALPGSLLWSPRAEAASGSVGSEFDLLTKKLLADWCDGMLRRQINDPDDPTRHGALACPSCDFIHGRCWEALYPMLHMAKVSGEKKYLEAAHKLFAWSANMDHKSGAWLNHGQASSWKGTTVFGAIALCDAIYYHGDLLSEEQLTAWKARLERAASGYLWTDFEKVDFTNINYGFTAVYGFDLIGRALDQQKYRDRSEKLAQRVSEFFTEPNALLFGEGKPNDNRSERNLLPVDLGYNVEESLNGVVLYALEKKDEKMLALLEKSLEGHLEFMLPDGAWDNSWGTRQFKWTYWGSRTSDGCQPAYALMADRNPAFATAAFKNVELYARCTSDGLLHGGPHYVSHGVPACIHHTFAHAKVLALIQDKMAKLPLISKEAPLPREVAKGVKEFPEVAVSLAARGPWRGTVSAYDSIYRTKSEPKSILHATGGSLALLHHQKVGTLFAGSMAKYLLVEPLNQQPNPDIDFPLTPRIEHHRDGIWFTNLYDLKAKVAHQESDESLQFDIETVLQNGDHKATDDAVNAYQLQYIFDEASATITAGAAGEEVAETDSFLVLPVLSPTGETVRQVTDRKVEIDKPEGTVVIESSEPLIIKETKTARVFNMVPGAEALPLMTQLPKTKGMKVTTKITVR